MDRVKQFILDGKDEGLEVIFELLNSVCILVRNSSFSFLQVVPEIPGKGRGVKATRTFQKGEFLLEYAGERLKWEAAKTREADYNRIDPYACGYMFYFPFKGETLW